MLVLNNFKDKIKEKFMKFIVEIILITIVLISLVIIFKSQISGLVNTILGKMSSQANTV